MSFNDYVAVANNASNDNKFNSNKSKSTIYQLKKLIKTLLRKKPTNTYKKHPEPTYFNEEDSEIEDNIANELLENEIFEDIDSCEEFSGVGVYHKGHLDVISVFRGQRYVPVHFARTEAGTFFWTSMMGQPDCDISKHGDVNSISGRQQPQIQVAVDRWAQA